MHTLPHDTLLETLLNSLEVERYVRAPLLLTVIDELSTSEVLAPAAAMAERLLHDLEARGVGDAEYVLRVTELRAFVHDLASPASGEQPSTVRPRVAESLARTSMRYESRSLGVA